MTNRFWVVKVGGEVALEVDAVSLLFDSIGRLGEDVVPIIVHGGGLLASSLATRLGAAPELVAGRRVTSDLDLQTILWSVCGEVNTRLVAAAARYGIRAVGLTGADGGLVRAARRPPRIVDGRRIDFGHVGSVEVVDPAPILALTSNGFLPIVATLGIGESAELLNINADSVAGRIASAIGADTLLFVTPSGGVMRVESDPATMLDECSKATFERGVADGWIAGGMRAKLEEAFAGGDAGVQNVFVCGVADIGRSSGTRIV